MQIGLKKAESTLAAASSLLSKLTGEKASWQQQADLLSQALLTLPATSVIAAAYIVYAAAVPENVRTELVRAWRSVEGLDTQDTFSLPQFLSKGGELTEWRAWGLPSDQVRAFSDLIASSRAEHASPAFGTKLIPCIICSTAVAPMSWSCKWCHAYL